MKTLQIKLILLLFAFTIGSVAQQKLNKISKSINVDKDVTIDLNTSYVQIEVDTWNKNVIEIEAYIDSKKLSGDALKKALEDWDITVEGSGDYVSITSNRLRNSWDNFEIAGFDPGAFDALKELEFELADLPEMPEMPEMFELPELPEMNFPEMPEMPELPELPEGVHDVNFDYDAYKKDGEKYLEKWSKEYEAKYGKEYKEKMKAWAKEFAKVDFKSYEADMEKWGEEFGKKFGKEYEVKMEAWSKKFDEKWGKDFEKKMEAWQEKHGKRLEEQAAVLEQRLEERERRVEERQEEQVERQEAMAKRLEERARVLEDRSKALERTIENRSSNVKKVIKIKMPKGAKLKMNVRHGELKFSSVINNLKANVSHSTLVADHIDGSETSINVSYSPVLINTWSLGELKLNYVDKAEIKNVERLVLNSNSSNININSLSGNAVIDGSFGDLSIQNILESFNNLNIILENSDALVTLPKTNHNFQYKGSRSRFSHPEKKTRDNVSTFSTNNLSSNKTIVVNAKFSNIVMQ